MKKNFSSDMFGNTISISGYLFELNQRHHIAEHRRDSSTIQRKQEISTILYFIQRLTLVSLTGVPIHPYFRLSTMDAETATVLRGRAKAALTRTINFIDKNEQTFDKNDIRNKLEKLGLTYTKFDKADAAVPIESSEMEEFETKYYCTKPKPSYRIF
ncbi:hypothetical protein TNCV_1390741 [Trichonephila clavipes]|nr:hypothetical protein TNCV_1390741 [Trichonephila clavipes]